MKTIIEQLKNITFEGRGAVLEKMTNGSIPSSKTELFKYTNPEKFFTENLSLGVKKELSETQKRQLASINETSKVSLVFKNGVFLESVSRLSPEVVLGQHAFEASHPILSSFELGQDFFEQLSSNLLPRELITLDFARKDESMEIALVYFNDEKSLSAPFVHLNLRPQTKVHVLEYSFCQDETSSTFPTLLAELSSGSSLHHINYLSKNYRSPKYSTAHFRLQKDAYLRTFSFDLTSSLNRNQLKIDLMSEGSNTDCYGLFAPTEDGQSDNYSIINHFKPQTFSNQHYKGILAGRAKGVFNGKIWVHPKAFQVVSNQLNNNLLLSDQARVHTQPTLLIDNEDVKCAHGATIGRLDHDQSFYLQSRGISPKRARQLLIKAFYIDLLIKIESEKFRNLITGILTLEIEETLAKGN